MIVTVLFLKIHGLISMPKKLLRFVTMIRVECNPDARKYAEAAALYFYGLANNTADFFGHIRSVLRQLDVFEQHHKLIATHARDRIEVAYTLL